MPPVSSGKPEAVALTIVVPAACEFAAAAVRMTAVELIVISGLSRKLLLSSIDEVLISSSETAPAVPINPAGTMVSTIRIASNTLRIRLLLAINIPPKN